jgi:hypothetical protein
MHLSKLKLDMNFQPCTPQVGEELFPNRLFEFNISQLLAFIQAHADRFPVERVELAAIPDYGGAHLAEATVRTADLSRPILLAEIAPGHYNVIDGQHRVARARREGVRAVPARRLCCPDHVRFLTSTAAYHKYVEYWNSKVDDGARTTRRKPSRNRVKVAADRE